VVVTEGQSKRLSDALEGNGVRLLERLATVRITADGDTAWSEWEMVGTRRDRSPFRMRGVAIYGVADDQAAWCRFYLEPVDEGSENIDAATRHVLTGGSGPAA